ncbi:MAG: M23 family metallopeptidase [Cyanobacteriota bacterium]
MYNSLILKSLLISAFWVIYYGLFNPVYSFEKFNVIAYSEQNQNVSINKENTTESLSTDSNNIQELKNSVLDLRKWVHSNSIVKGNPELVINNEDYYNQLSYINTNSSKLTNTLRDIKNNNNNNNKINKFKTFKTKKNLKISSSFGNRINPVTGLNDYHQGIDIPIKNGTPIFAYKSGIIKKINNNLSLNAGKYILVEHNNGSESYYMHLSEILVKSNQLVSQGEVIGLSGSSGRTTGPHLHFEIRKNNIAVNPLMIGDAKWYIKSY